LPLPQDPQFEGKLSTIQYNEEEVGSSFSEEEEREAPPPRSE